MKKYITVKNASGHNLDKLNIQLPTDELIVFSGVSGSGKSSLAFDTLFVEGQRRYVESLSTHARRYIESLNKPEADAIEGLSPTIAIDQKTAGKNPRSTVGTLTEIYDYLRVLYARASIAYCPLSHTPLSAQSQEHIIQTIENTYSGSRAIVLTPIIEGKKGALEDEREHWLKKGYLRARVDGQWVSLESSFNLDPNVEHRVELVIDRLKITPSEHSRLCEAIISALELSKGLVILWEADTEQEQLFSTFAYSEKAKKSYPALQPNDFSFNSPHGMCTHCHGLGSSMDWDLEQIIDPDLSISEDCCKIASSYETVRYQNIYNNLARIYDFKIETPWKKLSNQAKKVFLEGGDERWLDMQFVHPRSGKTWRDRVLWKGVYTEAWERYQSYKTEKAKNSLRQYLKEGTCPTCQGSRLKSYPSCAQFSGKKIHEVTAMSVEEALSFFQSVKLSKDQQLIAKELLKEITERLKFLLNVGLNYLTLDRSAPTLSGGEAQRVRLSSQIGSGLVGVTYILDEPSIGLHMRDNHKLIETLRNLQRKGNNVIVVEHDEDTILAADHVVDFGPGAGKKGGQIVFQGSPKDLLKSKDSLTGKYLSKRVNPPAPKSKKRTQKSITIHKASHNNLKEIDVEFPLELFIAVTGVSGSGKSSLISETLAPILGNHLHGSSKVPGKHKKVTGLDQINKAIIIDQSPIGRLPRSNPATYIKLFDEIRDLFSKLPESRSRGYTPGRFSFNVKEGSCSNCQGMGYVKIDMDFLEEDYVECPVCRGKQFDDETLSIEYKGLNIHDILSLSVDECLEIFQDHPKISQKLQFLEAVGLGYMPIGQPSTWLSGGEAQRIKLAKEMVRPASGQTIYILDEPTTGLHIHDIHRLLKILFELRDRGNTIIVIEHQSDVIKFADWIIDLGPEGGSGGGQLTGIGPPKQIAKLKTPTAEVIKAIPDTIQTKKIKKSKVQDLQKMVELYGAKHNNLKSLDLKIPRQKITVVCGPSGSGKSSLAFDSIYASGQRKYIESLSTYARQFVKQCDKPDLDRIEGLGPSIAIEQKIHAGNPRSTVGTLTEIFDYLRLLYTRLGAAHCPETGERIESVDKSWITQKVLDLPKNEKIQILAPIQAPKNRKWKELIDRFIRSGFVRTRINGTVCDLDEAYTVIKGFARKKIEFELVIDRLITGKTEASRLDQAIELALKVGKDQLIIHRVGVEDLFVNAGFCVPSTGVSYPHISPKSFAFNLKQGQCEECLGLGVVAGLDLFPLFNSLNQSVKQLLKWIKHGIGRKHKESIKQFNAERKISLDLKFSEYQHQDLLDLLEGTELSDGRFLGLNTLLSLCMRKKSIYRSWDLNDFSAPQDCPSCKGARINEFARHVTIHDVAIHELCMLPAVEIIEHIKRWKKSSSKSLKDTSVLKEVYEQLIHRLNFLIEVGLDYLSLHRSAPSLSNGEAQRIRLASQLGNGLRGVLYVLDEPTTGLHPDDCERLKHSLTHLKDLDNTLVIVEHDRDLIESADHIIELGPSGGNKGGFLSFEGSPKELKKKKTVSAQLVKGIDPLKAYKKNREIKKTNDQASIEINKATANQLKSLSVSFPLGVMSSITGLSGSGKTSLMRDVLFHASKNLKKGEDTISLNLGEVSGLGHFDKVLYVDSAPLGTTSRADVSSYTDLTDHLRDLYALLPYSKEHGLSKKNFSRNLKSGMCKSCWGMGYRTVDLKFLPPVKVPCDACNTLMLNPVSLGAKYKDLSLGEVYYLSVDQAAEHFMDQPNILRILNILQSVGLGYLNLGQSLKTLSGGEAQRLKLTKELKRKARGPILYLLDEPTKGLHPVDMTLLYQVLQDCLDAGHTIICIEHQIDWLRNSDYLVEIGPGAGSAGGQLIAQGSPLSFVKKRGSRLAKYL